MPEVLADEIINNITNSSSTFQTFIENNTLDRAAPSVRVAGRGAGSTSTPARGTEYNLAFSTVVYNDSDYFTATAGGSTIVIKKAGVYAVFGQFCYQEVAPAPFSDTSNFTDCVYYLMGDRSMHIKQNGIPLVDPHHSPSSNYTTVEASCSLRAAVGDIISATYIWNVHPGLSTAYDPFIPTALNYWPFLSLVYLGTVPA